MTRLKEAPPCPSCGSVACNMQSENFCRHTRDPRLSFTQLEAGQAAFDNLVEAGHDQVSALVIENQAARPLRDEKGNAFCQQELASVHCSLLMGHDDRRTLGDEAVDHVFPGPEDDDDRDEEEKQDDDEDGDTSDDGRLRDESKGVEDAPNKQVTRRKPRQGVETK